MLNHFLQEPVLHVSRWRRRTANLGLKPAASHSSVLLVCSAAYVFLVEWQLSFYSESFTDDWPGNATER